MANELPKKPIKRVTVPTVSKEIPTEPLTENKSASGQNIILLLLFLLVSGIVYVAIFQQAFLSKYTSFNSKPTPSINTVPVDSVTQNTDSLNNEEITNTIGSDRSVKNNDAQVENNNSVTYPAGTKYYLIAGTYIFYPYAEKCVSRMKALGYDAAIISTGEGRKFHRVYIESSTDGSAVRAKRDELNSSKNMNLWVYAE